MAIAKIHDEGQNLRTPSGKLLGIVESQAALEALGALLNDAGFGKTQYLIGDEGVALLERVGGFFFSDMEERVVAHHIEELKAGHMIVAIETAPDRVDEATKIASENGARRLVYFGPMAITWLTR